VAGDEAPPNETSVEVEARQRRRGGDVNEAAALPHSLAAEVLESAVPILE